MVRVLVADDEDFIREVMVELLEGAGYQVVAVPDGVAALMELRKSHFDVALVDVMMPRMDGYHLAQQIHALHDRPRIVIVTSRNYDSDKQALLAAGVDAYLPKPFANKDLLEVVANLIKKKNLK